MNAREKFADPQAMTETEVLYDALTQVIEIEGLNEAIDMMLNEASLSALPQLNAVLGCARAAQARCADLIEKLETREVAIR